MIANRNLECTVFVTVEAPACPFRANSGSAAGIVRLRLPQSHEGAFGEAGLPDTGMISFQTRAVRDAAGNRFEVGQDFDLFSRSLRFAQLRRHRGHIR